MKKNSPASRHRLTQESKKSRATPILAEQSKIQVVKPEVERTIGDHQLTASLHFCKNRVIPAFS